MLIVTPPVWNLEANRLAHPTPKATSSMSLPAKAVRVPYQAKPKAQDHLARTPTNKVFF